MNEETFRDGLADAQIKTILEGMRRIAVIGISAKTDRASHGIARFLAGRGYEVVGVNPVLKEDVLGLKIYPSLAAVPGRVDIVDIFRRSETVLPIIEAAIARKDGCVWMQEGVYNAAAAQLAADAGVVAVQDRCLYKEWLRLMNG